MSRQHRSVWFKIVSIILVGFGLLYVFFGLKMLPVHRHLVQWESALYGAIMTGWAVTLLLVGKVAFKRNDKELKQALLAGLVVWLALEAAASAWFGIWFNVGVDVAVAVLFAVPLLRR